MYLGQLSFPAWDRGVEDSLLAVYLTWLPFPRCLRVSTGRTETCRQTPKWFILFDPPFQDLLCFGCRLS